MTLHLDSRQRAMLAEMGVRVWLPAPGEVADSAMEALAAAHEADTTESTAPPAHTPSAAAEPERRAAPATSPAPAAP